MWSRSGRAKNERLFTHACVVTKLSVLFIVSLLHSFRVDLLIVIYIDFKRTYIFLFCIVNIAPNNEGIFMRNRTTAPCDQSIVISVNVKQIETTHCTSVEREMRIQRA